MKIAFFKTRCFVCWKGFEVPVLPDSSYGETLYFDKRDRVFAYFSWFENKEIDNFLSDFLTKNTNLQFLNDETKGNTARQLVGFIANGEKECILDFNRCPRCGIKFNSISNTKTETREIEKLNFSNFLKLNNTERHQFLLDRTKNGL